MIVLDGTAKPQEKSTLQSYTSFLDQNEENCIKNMPSPFYTFVYGILVL